ncbi:sensor histidine kinase [Chitinophagaceae bacterium MMS25-I14]
MDFLRLPVLFVMLVIMSSHACAQERLLPHFTYKNGLPSDRIYYIRQDSRGFIWFCTDQGISRYDGHEFRNFTSADGLPDNEIFKVEEDEYHHLWLNCYNKKTCFLYDEKIYDLSHYPGYVTGNLDWVRCVSLGDTKGKQMFSRRNVMAAITKYRSAGKLPDINSFIFIQGDAVYFVTGRSVFRYKNGTIRIVCHMEGAITGFFHSDGHLYLFKLFDGSSYMQEMQPAGDTLRSVSCQKIPFKVYCAVRYNDSLVAMGTDKGAIFFRDVTRLDTTGVLLPGVVVNTLEKDMDGNLWMGTLTDGAFVLNHSASSLFSRKSGLNNDHTMSACYTSSGYLVAGAENGIVSIIKSGIIKTIALTVADNSDRVYRLREKNRDTVIACTDNGLYAIDLRKAAASLLVKEVSVKSCFADGNNYFAATSIGGIYYKGGTPAAIPRYIWRMRTTAVAPGKSKTIWLGTLDGVWIYKDGQINKFCRDSVLSHSRITDVVATVKNTVAISTHQNGIYLYSGDNLLHITEQQGLSSNICNRLFADRYGNIWVCTNKGLAEIILSGAGYTITHFFQSDGLPDYGINDVAVYGDTVYVATTDGVVVFNARKNIQKIPVRTYITSVQLKDTILHSSQATLNYKQNDIRINYTGISFTDNKNIVYRYTFSGLNTDTFTTTLNSIHFNSLAPGSYTFTVSANMKNGIAGIPASFSFVIAPPFWKTPWFILLEIVTFFSGTYVVYRERIKTIQRKETEKALRHQHIAELEMQALRAQINPHFIFNAFSSIQHYYSMNDERSANRYMTAFARLIRSSLTHAADHWISLSDEINMLDNYISLEQMRLEYSFTYEITAPSPGHEIRIPAMLIQPYVENAINHGLRHLKDRAGKLDIIFSEMKEHLVCIIDDNGIGFARAAIIQNKANSHKSMGMRITQRRIDTINQLYQVHIEAQTFHKDNDGGTKVVIMIPLKFSSYE